MAIDSESLTGSRKADRARELVAFCRRRNRLAELTGQIRRLRPHAIDPVTEPRAVPAVAPSPSSATTLKQLWQAALSAFLRRDWPRAAELLAQVGTLDPGYRDAAARLAEARRRREERYDAALAACERADWLAAAEGLDALLAETPDDEDARLLLEHARAQSAEQERRAAAERERKQRERYGQLEDHIRAGRYAEALSQAETLLVEWSDDREVVARVAALIENTQVPLDSISGCALHG